MPEPAFVTPPLDRLRIAQFALAMRDPNPVHRDDAFCRNLGLPGVIAPGGMAAVAIAHAVARRYGLGAIREIDIRFRSPIPAGERLVCHVEAEGESEAGTLLRCRAEGSDGAVRADGTVTVAARPESTGALA